MKTKYLVIILLLFLILISVNQSLSFVASRPAGGSQYYYPDHNLADQGSTTGRSVKNLVDSIGSTRKTSMILAHLSNSDMTAYTFNTNETIPANITLEIEPGAYINGSAIVTINGSFIAASVKCFDPDGPTIIFGDPNDPNGTVEKIDKIDPKWWGAVGNDSTDDSVSLQIAANASQQSILWITKGSIYQCSNIDIISNIRIAGGGTLKLKALGTGIGDPILNITGNNIEIDGIKFDGNKANQFPDGWSDSWAGGLGGTGRSYRAAIKCDGDTHSGLSNIKINNCYFISTYGAALAGLNVDGIRFINNKAEDLDMEMVYLSGDLNDPAVTECNDIIIEGNTGYDIASGHATVNANFMLIDATSNAVIKGNICREYERNFCKIQGSEDIILSNNTGEPGSVSVNFGFANLQPYKRTLENIIITGNVSKRHGRGLNLTGDEPTINLTISKNLFDGSTHPSIPDGMVISNPNITNLVISENTIKDPNRHGIYINSNIKNLIIGKNIIYSSDHNPYAGIYFYNATYNTLENVKISDNIISGFCGDSGVGGSIVISDNVTSITNFSLQDNIVITDDSTSYFCFQEITSAKINAGIISNNYFKGKILGRSATVMFTNNVVTGSCVWNPASGSENSDMAYGIDKPWCYHAEEMPDEGTVNLPSSISGWGWLQVGNAEEYAYFRFTEAGSVTLIDPNDITTANIDNTDTDDKFCIYDGGAYVILKNRLGTVKKVHCQVFYQ